MELAQTKAVYSPREWPAKNFDSLKFILELEPGGGCTDNTACNYDPVATWNDGSCTYAEENYN